MPQTVIYIGTKTAYYNDRSYFPGEVFQVPDVIPVRDVYGDPVLDDQGEQITKPLVFGRRSKLRLATEEEVEAYKNHPRNPRRKDVVGAIPFRGAFAKSTQRPGTAPKFDDAPKGGGKGKGKGEQPPAP